MSIWTFQRDEPQAPGGLCPPDGKGKGALAEGNYLRLHAQAVAENRANFVTDGSANSALPAQDGLWSWRGTVAELELLNPVGSLIARRRTRLFP